VQQLLHPRATEYESSVARCTRALSHASKGANVPDGLECLRH
jgi:hypothetical protein